MTRLRPKLRRGASARQARPVAATARRAWATVAAVMIGGASSVFACPQCFGAEETTLVGGTKLGILVLLGVTLAVQGAFVGFFLYLRKRARRFAAFESATDWPDLQRASRPS